MRLQSFDGGGPCQAPEGEPGAALVDQPPPVELHQGVGHVGGPHPEPARDRPRVRTSAPAEIEEGPQCFDEELLVHILNMRAYCSRVQFPVCSSRGCYDYGVMSSDLPPCGLYRTTAAIGDVPADRLVLFHNHGDPGPGVYLPTGWSGNRARFAEQGTTLPDPSSAATLEPLAPEGLYRVAAPFTCCEKNCRTFETDMLVQLGYDGAAHPIVFVPEWTSGAIAIPERGTRIDRERTTHLAPLKVAEPRPPATPTPSAAPGGATVH